MSEAFQRRFKRYLVPERALRSQLKGKGVLSIFSSWKNCTIRDISHAGMRIECKESHGMNDDILIKIEEGGRMLMFNGQVVNASLGTKGHYVMGVSLDMPENDTPEEEFMLGLETRFVAAD